MKTKSNKKQIRKNSKNQVVFIDDIGYRVKVSVEPLNYDDRVPLRQTLGFISHLSSWLYAASEWYKFRSCFQMSKDTQKVAEQLFEICDSFGLYDEFKNV